MLQMMLREDSNVIFTYICI